jgi:hypothetical protein
MMLNDVSTMQDTAISAQGLLLCPAVCRLSTCALSCSSTVTNIGIYCLCWQPNFFGGRDKNSLVCVLIMQRPGRPRNRGSIPSSGQTFFFFRASKRVLGPNKHPIQGVPVALYPPKKQPERKVCHSSPSNVEDKNEWGYTSILSCSFMVCTDNCRDVTS